MSGSDLKYQSRPELARHLHYAHQMVNTWDMRLKAPQDEVAKREAVPASDPYMSHIHATAVHPQYVMGLPYPVLDLNPEPPLTGAEQHLEDLASWNE